MSYYRLEVKIFGRTGGKSSVAAAAYRAGENLHDERLGKTFPYADKKDVERSLILAPDGAPDWVYDRQELWNRVEAREDQQKRHATAQVAREVTIDFPRELSKDQREALAIDFVTNEFVDKGMMADINFHNKTASDGGEKPHAHIMLTMRDFDGEEFQNKNRSWNNAVFTKDDYIKDKTKLVGLRGRYADYVNDALNDAGSDATVSHLTNAENGKEIKHPYQSIAIYQMDKKGKYNEFIYEPLEKKSTDFDTAFMNGLQLPDTQKALQDRPNRSNKNPDWEYIQARKSVEVDAKNYITPLKPSNHMDGFYYSPDLGNDREFDR